MNKQLTATVIMVFLPLVLVVTLPGCGSVAMWVGKQIGNEVVERVDVLEEAADVIIKRLSTLEDNYVPEDEKFPLATLLGLLAIGGLVAGVCAWKIPPLVGPVAIGAAGLCVAIILKTYMQEILIVSGVTAAALVVWRLATYFGLFKDLATDKAGTEKGIMPKTEKAVAAITGNGKDA